MFFFGLKLRSFDIGTFSGHSGVCWKDYRTIKSTLERQVIAKFKLQCFGHVKRKSAGELVALKEPASRKTYSVAG